MKIQGLLQLHTFQIIQKLSNPVRFESNFLNHQSVVQIKENLDMLKGELNQANVNNLFSFSPL